ncbi:hypothetical protein QL285_028225 [Trifolium repens]|nr:hypothetical protein QL285_028225 [Trifolium repens]
MLVSTIFCGNHKLAEPQPSIKRHRQDSDTKPIWGPTLRFTNHDLINGSPSEDQLLLVIATISDCDVSRILIDQGTSCDIMYNVIK